MYTNMNKDKLFELWIEETGSDLAEPFNDPSIYKPEVRNRLMKTLSFNMWLINKEGSYIRSEIVNAIKRRVKKLQRISK